jgi:hypothetical protein
VVLSLSFIVIGTLVAMAAFYVVRRYLAPPGGYYHDAEVASGIFGVVGTGYAVVLGFVLFIAFGSYDSARVHVAAEAVALRQLNTASGFFVEPYRDQMRGDLVCYGRATVSDEWLTMEDGKESPTVNAWVTAMENTLHDTPINTPKESAALQSWFERNQERQEGRRGRIAESSPFVPGFVWAMLSFLLVVVIFYQCLFAEPRVPLFAQAVGVAAMAATLLAALTLIWVLDRPFNDRGAMISNERIAAATSVIEASLVATNGTPPCDANGNSTR